jgi:hypothetical protein
MDEDTGEIKVKRETVIIAAHFFLFGQFLGFSGSSGPSHVTCRRVINAPGQNIPPDDGLGLPV